MCSLEKNLLLQECGWHRPVCSSSVLLIIHVHVVSYLIWRWQDTAVLLQLPFQESGVCFFFLIDLTELDHEFCTNVPFFKCCYFQYMRLFSFRPAGGLVWRPSRVWCR